MKQHRTGRPAHARGARRFTAALRATCLGAAAFAAASCNTIDTNRVVGPTMSLGDDIFGVLCDRVGASSIPEDLSGASYAKLCHADAQGAYADLVDQSGLPKPDSAAADRARKLSVAKLERMAQRRRDLIQALNAAFPADPIPDPTTGGTIPMHDALMTFAQTLTSLYEENPFAPGGTPLVPSQTRAMRRVFDALGAPGTCAAGGQGCAWNAECGDGGYCASEPRDAMAGMWGRRGYRPYPFGLGVTRPALGYKDLRQLTLSTLSVLGPGGSASAELQQALTVAQQEMLTASPSVSSQPPLTVDADRAEPSRPRQDMEFLQALLLTEGDSFQADAKGTKMFLARRDARGFVVPAGNTPGVPGTVKPPFVDLQNDGYADVDGHGVFIDAAGAALDLEPPFGIPGVTTGAIDQYGKSVSSASKYSYLDASRTLVGGLTRHLAPLLDPTVLAPGDPKAWQKEHETAMYALAGAYVLFGDRVDAEYDYAQEGTAGSKVKYRGFAADDSPLPDLIHAAGQVLGDADSDALLQSLIDLTENHEQVVARLLGAALRINDIAKAHDERAAQGLEPKAELAYEVTFWEEMADIISDITSHPGLMAGLVAALADPTTVQKLGNVDHMGDALSRFVSYRDELGYNPYGTHFDGTWDNQFKGTPGGINGLAVNHTIGGGSTQDPQTPVDWTAPQAGKNRSCLERSLQLIHDSNGGPACNKAGAKVNAKLGPIGVAWPMFGSGYDQCELFQFDNLAIFYLNSMLPIAHPKRSFLKIKASDLNSLMSVLQGVGGDVDQMLQESSDIEGLTQHPESYALNRLVFYGASSQDYPGMPDYDSNNSGKQFNKFISGTIEPVSSRWCPPSGPNGVPTCSSASGTLRVRDPNTIFLWERFGFTKYLAPLGTAFANLSCTPDLSSCDQSDFTGEQLFVRIFELLSKHFPGPDHGPECSKSNPDIYCPESGLNRYQPILAEAFLTDIIPALHEFAKIAVAQKVTVKRGPHKGEVWSGAEVVEKLTKVLFSKQYAKSVGMKDRKGSAATTWVDGTPQPQLTVYTLFADALHKMDQRWVDACDCAKKTGPDKAACEADVNACRADADDRKGQWKRARSQLVDAFLAVDGEGTSASFHNPTVNPTLLATLKLAREQTNARCKDRESGAPCDWARRDLGDKLAGVMKRPLFAAIVDVTEKVRRDEGARRELGKMLQVVLGGTGDTEALQGTLTSVVDLLQVLVDDGRLTPLLKAAAPGLAPDADPAGAGAASIGIQVLKAMTDDKYDKYHVMDHVLPRLVTPMNDGKGLAPIEIFMDVIADVNRIDAASQGPMANDDYEGVMSTMQGFMTDQTRGLEQLYTIIQKRPKQ